MMSSFVVPMIRFSCATLPLLRTEFDTVIARLYVSSRVAMLSAAIPVRVAAASPPSLSTVLFTMWG